MDFALQNNDGIVSMSYDAVNDIRNNIILSLLVKKGSFFLDLNFGSRLHEITSATPSDLNLIKSYCSEALSWMVTIKKVKSFDITAILASVGKIEIVTIAHLNDGTRVTYSTFLRIM